MATTITKDLLRNLRGDIDAALKAVGEKHGVVMQLGNATFFPTNATFKLLVNAKDAAGEVITKEMADLKRYLPMLGMKDEHLTQVLELNGEHYTLAGYRTKASSKPFLAKRVRDGRVFIIGEDSIRRGLGLQLRAAGF